jgi:glycosyltransferase involved in cell wall biosynthesis
LAPDIVIACDAEAAWAVGGGHGFRRMRLVWHFHELPERQPQGFSVNLANRWVWRHARRPDLVVFPDPGRASVFAADAGIDADTIPIVANCPRALRDLPQPSTRSALGDRVPAGARIVLYHGPIGPDHGLETAVRSMRWWPDAAVLVLKGSGSADYVERLRALAATEGVAGRVLIYSPGFQSYAEHCAFIAGADLGWTALAAVSRNWEFSAHASNKRFECMALGVPQATNRGPLLEALIEEGGCGVCVPIDDPEVVGKTIAGLLADPAKRAGMASAGRRLHLERFHYDGQFDPVLRWLKDGAVKVQ